MLNKTTPWKIETLNDLVEATFALALEYPLDTPVYGYNDQEWSHKITPPISISPHILKDEEMDEDSIKTTICIDVSF